MRTYIYMIRHGESPKVGDERVRELTERGMEDSARITELLVSEGIDVFVSSPYKRAILTIEELAKHSSKEVIGIEDLKERVFFAENFRLPDSELMPIVERSFAEPDYALEGAESNATCQKRAVAELQQLLTQYQGKKVAIGTHGAVMTLMMNYYDDRYDLNFLLHTTKPDVYRMEFVGQELVDVMRMWS
ncbi:histidine phosphatase family protein [Paenibacillus sp. N1-5-1-14]|uniref:histidine phosphatase family protein n=1 Tax=Paenibacillus radicibacter TaxID=2972488 RepID=UPI0021591FC1|nr:histidine phosphatase family protein [Paenibacillus radicibacter]MCR8645692.1 histidine phosphatase family protein [Paenibacillus radicibacter]